MTDLFLAILCSSMISSVMRIGEQRCQYRYGMLVFNYVTCSVISAFTITGLAMPHGSPLTTTVGLGFIAGILFLSSFALLQWNVRKNGVVLSALFMKLGIMIPTLMSILLFGEHLTTLRLLGLLLALAGIFIFNFEKGANRIAAPLMLIILLILGGSAEGMSKVFEVFGRVEFNKHYLFVTFTVALVLCIALLLYSRQRITKNEIFWGICVGLPNYLSTLFLLRSLNVIDASVAYPVYCIGTIALVAVFGVFIFHEKMSPLRLFGMAVIAAAVTILNLG